MTSTPLALPMTTTTCSLARTAFSEAGDSIPLMMVLPSAMMEIQEDWLACIFTSMAVPATEEETSGAVALASLLAAVFVAGGFSLAGFAAAVVGVVTAVVRLGVVLGGVAFGVFVGGVEASVMAG